MTHAADARIEGRDEPPMPLVSIIIPNFNYGRFIEQAVVSAMSQTYSPIECVVVDDCSTDDSRSIIADLQQRFPSLKVILRDTNGGTLPTIADGVRATTGAFVHVMDADDFVSRDFIAAHVALHVLLPQHVGFTCCNTYQLLEGGVVSRHADAICRGLANKHVAAVPLDFGSAGAIGDLFPGHEALAANTYTVDSQVNDWVWATTSAMVFRRRVLELFIDIDPHGVKGGFDGFLCRGSNAVAGSAILDVPLAYYRYHSQNLFSNNAPLANAAFFNPETEAADRKATVEALLNHVEAHRDRFEHLFVDKAGAKRLSQTLAAWNPFPLAETPKSSLTYKVKSRHFGPLVSFIVVNHNYGAFLEECIVSIVTQTYANVECIIVDNNSTDHSRALIETLRAKYHNLKVILSETNLGQNAACQLGFAEASGSYIAFVDADDYYLPDFAEEHLRVHLTSQIAIGFTSSEMIQRVGDEIIVAYYFGPSKDVYRLPYPAGAKQHRLSSMATAIGRTLLEPADDADDDEGVSYVRKECIDWVWAPTSGNLYRRDAVGLFIDNPRLKEIKLGADTYFNFGINAVCGSALIGKTLAVYRIHGVNNFSKTAQLSGLVSFKRDTDPGSVGSLFALEHLVKNIDRFWAQNGNMIEIYRVMATLLRRASRRHVPTLDRILLSMARRYFARNVDKWQRHYLRNRVLQDYLRVDAASDPAPPSR